MDEYGEAVGLYWPALNYVKFSVCICFVALFGALCTQATLCFVYFGQQHLTCSGCM